MRNLIAAERQTVNRRSFTPTDHEALQAAITHRTTTVYQQAINERPEWLIEFLTELDDRGTLEQLRPRQLHRLVLETVTTSDLGLGDRAIAEKRRFERAPAWAM